MHPDLLNRFRQFISEGNLFTAADKLLLAVSGGMDSVVLCTLCREAGYDFDIAHCNFRLRGAESERDENFVQQLGVRLGVQVHVKHFDTEAMAAASGTSIETTARNLRYNWFRQLMGIDEPGSRTYQYLLTAHHADDNVETVMMHFFRGTGIKGLTGIPVKNEHIRRPLLFVRRAAIAAYAKEKMLGFVTDSSNAENLYTRNFFRNELIPAVRNVFPAVEDNILANIKRMEATAVLANDAIGRYKKKLLVSKNGEVWLPVLQLLRTPAHDTILYHITKPYGFTPGQLPDMLSLLQSVSGKFVSSATHRILRNRAWLIISALQNRDTSLLLINEGEGSMAFENGKLQLRVMPAGHGFEPSQDPHAATLDAAAIEYPLILRKWTTGDYFYPLGMEKKKKLSRFFIDAKLSLADKEKVWVLESNKRILWVIGMRIDNRFRVKPSTTSALVIKLSAD